MALYGSRWRDSAPFWGRPLVSNALIHHIWIFLSEKTSLSNPYSVYLPKFIYLSLKILSSFNGGWYRIRTYAPLLVRQKHLASKFFLKFFLFFIDIIVFYIYNIYWLFIFFISNFNNFIKNENILNKFKLYLKTK